MDDVRFDRLVQSLARPGSRRRLLAGLAAGALGLAGLDRAAARACSAPGAACREHATCCSKLCGPKDATGRRRCRCRTGADCPALGGAARTCRGGSCVVPPAKKTAPAPFGVDCAQNGDCASGICACRSLYREGVNECADPVVPGCLSAERVSTPTGLPGTVCGTNEFVSRLCGRTDCPAGWACGGGGTACYQLARAS